MSVTRDSIEWRVHFTNSTLSAEGEGRRETQRKSGREQIEAKNLECSSLFSLFSVQAGVALRSAALSVSQR